MQRYKYFNYVIYIVIVMEEQKGKATVFVVAKDEKGNIIGTNYDKILKVRE